MNIFKRIKKYLFNWPPEKMYMLFYTTCDSREIKYFGQEYGQPPFIYSNKKRLIKEFKSVYTEYYRGLYWIQKVEWYDYKYLGIKSMDEIDFKR